MMSSFANEFKCPSYEMSNNAIILNIFFSTCRILASLGEGLTNLRFSFLPVSPFSHLLYFLGLIGILIKFTGTLRIKPFINRPFLPVITGATCLLFSHHAYIRPMTWPQFSRVNKLDPS